MGALANRDFVKMNGLGNEIVIVDLRRSDDRIAADEGALSGTGRQRRLDPHLQQ